MSSDSSYNYLYDEVPKTIRLEVKDPGDKIKEESNSDGIVGSLLENVVIKNQVIPVNKQLQLSNHLPIITILPPSPNFDDPFSFLRISKEEWDMVIPKTVHILFMFTILFAIIILK